MDKQFGAAQSVVEAVLHEARSAGCRQLDSHEAVASAASSGFASWDQFLDLCAAAAEWAGGPQRYADLVHATFMDAMPHFQHLAAALPSQLAFAQFALQLVDASAFPGVRYEAHVQGPEAIELRLQAKPGWSLSSAVVHGVAGALRNLSIPFAGAASKVDVVGSATAGTLSIRMPRCDVARPELAAVPHAMQSMLRAQRDALEHRHQLLSILAVGERRAEQGSTMSRAASERLVIVRERWNLTTREAELLAAVSSGLTNKEAAAQFGRAEVTIERLMTQLFRKAAVMNRTELVARFYAV